ncbi:hypothetical protein ACFQ36_07640 [Arthrobacter sp. GCM10027362]|uniref:hypothetical protein n=1 Tax=Arthrobacter sp. GCM10027362 TaxID=3273379 RepID=UPI00363D9B1C
MVFAFSQDLPVDDDTYRRVVEAMGTEPFDGLILHLCMRKDSGGLRYIDVWESEEQCNAAYAQRIRPAVERVLGGRRPATEPEAAPLEVVDLRGKVVGARIVGEAAPTRQPPYPDPG